MTDTLGLFAEQVTGVARTVGVEGKLGGQAEVPGVAGTWKDLTDNVNFMASNLTTQVRGIARVVTAVANGNLNRKLEVEALGEIGPHARLAIPALLEWQRDWKNKEHYNVLMGILKQQGGAYGVGVECTKAAVDLQNMAPQASESVILTSLEVLRRAMNLPLQASGALASSRQFPREKS
jgi:HAMP domain-containing protein